MVSEGQRAGHSKAVNPFKVAAIWWNVKKLKKAVSEEKRMNNYDPAVGAKKALRDFVITALAIGGAAVASYFSVPENLATVLGFLPDTIEKALIAILSPLFVFGYNWLKERNR